MSEKPNTIGKILVFDRHGIMHTSMLIHDSITAEELKLELTTIRALGQLPNMVPDIRQAINYTLYVDLRTDRGRNISFIIYPEDWDIEPN